jgi:hypothetical protein
MLCIDLVASTQWWELFKILLLKIHVVCGVDFNNILSATIVLLVVILSAANRSIKFWLHDTAVMCSDWGCPSENWKLPFSQKGDWKCLQTSATYNLEHVCVFQMAELSIDVDMNYFVWINVRAYLMVSHKRQYMKNLLSRCSVYMQL